MLNPPKPGPGSQGVRIVKVPVSEATYQELNRQAQQANGYVSSYCSPVLTALAAGTIRHELTQAPPAPVAPPPLPPSFRERLLAIPRLTPASRAVLAYVAEQYLASGGQCVVETNRELAQVLGFSWRAVSSCISALETAGYLKVKLHASGANGRQLWPTDKVRLPSRP